MVYDSLQAIIDTASRCGLLDATHRDFLLDDLPPAFRTHLPELSRPDEQTLSDLLHLNRQYDPPPAIVSWLWAAARLTHDVDCRLTFLTFAQSAADRWWAEHASAGARRVEPSQLTAGTFFDRRFRLLRVLSDGQFSVVWLAEDSVTDQQVALKMPMHLLDARGRQRLRRGARHLCKMSHPNLVKVFDLCEPADAARPLYYWMEYLPGGDLYRALVERRIAGRGAIRAVMGAGDGLAASHARRVWHRDVRPENILLGAEGRARLADFDLLHAVEASEGSGQLASVAFAAPEALADLASADHRADVFGLARTIQFSLFVDANPEVAPGELGPLWARRVMGGIEPGVLRCATDLEAVLGRATSLDPAQRHPSVAVFLRDLRDALQDDGSRLGRRFVVEEEVATLPDRTLYRGTDTRFVEPDHAPPRVLVERFSPEASAAIDEAFPGGRWSDLDLGIRHAGIVPVRGRGRDHDGCYWQVTDLRDGRRALPDAITDLLAAEDDPFHVLARLGGWLNELAGALAHAHKRGIAHRSLAETRVSVWRDRCQLEEWTRARGRATPPDDDDLPALGGILCWAARRVGGLVQRATRLDTRPSVQSAARVALDEAIGRLDALGRTLRSDSPASAEAASEALRRWTDEVGDRRTLALAERERSEAELCAAEARRLHDGARRRLRALAPWASEDEKSIAWELEDEANDLLERARASEQRWLAVLETLFESLPRARERWIQALLARLSRADETDDRAQIAHLEARLARHRDEPRIAEALATAHTVTFSWSAPIRAVTVSRYAQRRRRLVLVDPVDLDPGGRATMELSRGDYRIDVVTVDGTTASWPARISRRAGAGQRTITLPAWLLTGLAADEACIPGGPCIIGGGHEAIDALPRCVVSIPAFVMKKRPVTHGEYLAFLASLTDSGRHAEAERYLPRSPITLPDEIPSPQYVLGADERYTLPRGGGTTMDHPVSGVSWFAAMAYAEYLAATTGQPWRLPGELEWEKAARGIDGRPCPWGAHVDEAFGNVVNSHKGPAAPMAVDAYCRAFPADRSPYGVEGLGGNMRTWTRDRWFFEGFQLDPCNLGASASTTDRPIDPVTADTLMVIRGSAWSAGRHHMRSANRYADRAGRHPTTAGIRLVRSLADRAGPTDDS